MGLRSLLATLAALVLPAGSVKNRLLCALMPDWKIHPDAIISHVLIAGVGSMSIADETEIGLGTVLRGLNRLEMGLNSNIGSFNWISTAVELHHLNPGGGTLVIGEGSNISSRHYIDCSGGVTMGRFGGMGGVRSTILTHGVDTLKNEQTSRPCSIGPMSILSSNCVMTSGAEVPDHCVVGAGSTVLPGLTRSYALYAGAPAKFKAEMPADSAFFHRVRTTILPPLRPAAQRTDLSGRQMSRRTARVPGASAVALLVVLACLGFTGYVLTRNPTPAPTFSPAKTSNAGTTQVGVPTRTPSVLFIGDSFTEGTGALNPREGYPCLTAVAMGWTCNIDAQGGTGFVNDGHSNSLKNVPLAGRLDDDVERYVADVVVLDAGRNDGSYPIAQVGAAMRSYLAAVHKAFPKARLVMIVPAYVNSTPANYPFGVQLGQEMRDALKKYDGVLVDPLAEGWRGGRSMTRLTIDDRVHLAPYGQRLWAQHLTRALKNAGLADVRAAPLDGP